MLDEPGRDIPEIKMLMTPNLLETISAHYRSHVDIRSISVWRNLSVDIDGLKGKSRYVYSSSWHTDRHMPCMLKLFYLIHDTTENHGPLHIINRPVTKKISLISIVVGLRKPNGSRRKTSCMRNALPGARARFSSATPQDACIGQASQRQVCTAIFYSSRFSRPHTPAGRLGERSSPPNGRGCSQSREVVSLALCPAG